MRKANPPVGLNYRSETKSKETIIHTHKLIQKHLKGRDRDEHIREVGTYMSAYHLHDT